MELTSRDKNLLAGAEGSGAALAMRVVVRVAEAMGASRLLDITSAHVDGCLYHGQVSLDFVRALADGGASVQVPTTLNVASLDLLHPGLVRAGDDDGAARQVMATYEALGCQPTWTCAPYQLPARPSFGEQIAWAESNAIVFANSVLGARTERYGDFIDIAAALTGRAPAAGLHLDEGRRATLVITVEADTELMGQDAFYPLLGHVLGRLAGSQVAAIVGLPSDTGEDRLKAIGAAAASSGSVAMFHAVGITPEAPELASVADAGARRIDVDAKTIRAAAAELSTAQGDRVDAVCLGTPHYSAHELARLSRLIGGRALRLPIYVNTSRSVTAEAAETVALLEGAGVQIVTDTCSYLVPVLAPDVAAVMTDSAKWAYYAPANLGVGVLFGGVEACVETAVTGRVVGL